MNNVWHTRISNLSVYSLYVAVASLPFSVLICHIALITFMVCWLFDPGLRDRFASLRTNYPILALLALGIWMCIGILYSENIREAWFSLERKAFFFLIPVVFATSSLLSQRLTNNILTVFCYSCALALLICYSFAWYHFTLFERGIIGADALNYLPPSATGPADLEKKWMFFSYVRLSAALKIHPTYLALYVAFCCIILVYRNLTADISSRQRIIHAGLVIFFTISIIFLASRIIVVILCVFYIGILFQQMTILRKGKSLHVLLPVLLMIIIAGVFVNPVTRYRQIDEILSTGISVSPNKHYTNSTGIRTSLWWLSVKAVSESNLLFGVGTGDVKDVVAAMGQKYGVTNILNSYDPHNEYLYILLSSGLIGMLFFSVFIGAAVVKAIQNRDIIFLNFMLLFLMVCLTESVLELQKGVVFFTLFYSVLSFRKTESNSIRELTLAGARQ